MKIIHIIGARPQFIKYFPIGRYISAHMPSTTNLLIHTGQHYDYRMSRIFFDELGIKHPDYHIGAGSGPHGEQTGTILKEIERILVRETPSAVIIYGDTNSTLGGALAAAKLHIPVVHIEAGLRSFNRNMPEEVNRVVADHVSTLLLCPSMAGVKNLENEGITQKICTGALITAGYFKKHTLNATADKPVVINTGDVMQDVILYTAAVAGKNSTIIKDMSLSAKEYYLLTVHRAENTDSAARLCEIIKFVNKTSDNKAVVFPMHPRTKKMYRNSTAKFANNVRIVDPVGYFDLIQLLKNAKMLMTDSGGMQKEAFWLAVPCITLRNETEWIETIESGWNVLFKNYRGKHKILRNNLKCYGDGNAAKRIGEAIFALIANRTR